MRIIAALVVVLMLGACVHNSAQECAGMNCVEWTYDDQGRPVVVVRAGKEAEELLIEFEKDDIKLRYEAKGVKAFPGQEARAVVEQAQVEAVGKVVPELTNAIISGLIPLF